MNNMDTKHSELLPCPFCAADPSIQQDKVYHCQLHGEPSQSIIVFCKNNNCVAKPRVVAGDCYNHPKGMDFKEGKHIATEEAIKKWNTRANSYYPDKALIGELVDAVENAEPVVWDACDSYYRSGMFPSLDAALEKYHEPIAKLLAALSKAQGDLTHRSAIDDVKELWFKEEK